MLDYSNMRSEKLINHYLVKVFTVHGDERGSLIAIENQFGIISNGEWFTIRQTCFYWFT